MSSNDAHPTPEPRGLGPDEPHVSFLPEHSIRPDVEEAFQAHAARLRALIPTAELHHIGSTAIPGALTKGDLDIEVRVDPEHFERAEAVLLREYTTNPDMRKPGAFAYFADDSLRFPLGILLTTPTPENDSFRAFRDALRADAELIRDYNDLKQRSTGLPMDAYREAKTAFIERVLERRA